MSLIDNLHSVGIRGQPNNKGEIGLNFCPFHNHNHRSPSLSINVEKNRFRCFACDERGKIPKLLAKLGLKIESKFTNAIPSRRCLESLLDELPVSFKNSDNLNFKLIKNIKEKELEDYKYDHPYLLNRGFTKEILKINKIGFDVKRCKVTIPIFFNGSYYGCIKREVVQDFDDFAQCLPKYVYPRDLEKGRIFYKPNTIKSLTNEFENVIIITEGSLDALRTAQFGIRSLSVLGAYVSLEQISILKKMVNKTIILGLDNDRAGKMATTAFLNANQLPNIKIFKHQDGTKDIGEMTQEQIFNGIRNSEDGLLWLIKN